MQKKVQEGFISFGKITPLMKDETIEAIDIKGLDGVWFVRGGKREKSPIVFDHTDELAALINQLKDHMKHNEKSTEVTMDTGLLPDNSRVIFIHPSKEIKKTTIQIRKIIKPI